MTKAVQSENNTASTGISGLDTILMGGLPSSRFILLEGAPGTGKTTLAIQFLLDGARKGESGLYITLSETKEELNGVAASHGWDLSKITLFDLEASDEDGLPDGQYTFFHPSEVELGQTTQSLIDEFERIQPKRVVFDSLSEMRLLARDPLKYRRQVLSLKQYFTRRSASVMVLDDLTSSDSDLQPQSIAHGVISLEKSSPDYGTDRRRLIITKMRGVGFIGGYHDYVIEKGGIRVFPRLIANKHGVQFERRIATSESPELNKLLGGGIDYGSSNLILGPAGSGKSSLALHFIVAALKRGEKAVIYLFDENARSYIERSEGINLSVKKFIDSKQLAIKQIDPAELVPGQFAQMVRDAVEKDQVKCLIIDSLSGYMHAMPEERALILHVHELLTYLSQMGVLSILLLVQHGLVGRMDSSAIDLSYIADSAFLLRYFESQGKVRKAISVLKKRSGYHEDTVREFSFSRQGLKVGGPLSNFEGILTGNPRLLDLPLGGKSDG
ncbi:MAG: circadian clock protein KaiC [Proteobacteria bacterium]|nr:MAG: circadian clock protein KaiC [Pseudomonadota bacterium]